MAAIEEFKSVTEAATTSGTSVSCEPYLTHPGFRLENELCAQLHYTFLYYVPNRSGGQASQLRNALILFLDFRAKYHRLNPAPLHLNSVSDLTAGVFRQFERYLQQEHHLGDLTTRAEIPLARLRSALNFVAQQTGEIPPLLLPSINYDRGTKTEPLDESTFRDFELALKKHIDRLRVILENRIKLDSIKPYTFDELVNFVNPGVTCESLVQWYQFFFDKNKKAPDVGRIKYYLNKSDDPVLVSMRALPSSSGELTSAWKNFYEGEGKKYQLSTVTNPFGTTLHGLVLDELRMLKTLIVHGYPLELSSEDLLRFNSRTNVSWRAKTGHVLDYILSYCFKPGRAKARLNVTEILNQYFPSYVDMVIIAMFIMVQTGWNKETVLAIDPEDFEATMSGLLDEDVTTIFSEKNRGQGNELPYYSPKRFNAMSSKKDKYSAYNLIRLAQALAEPFFNLEFDSISVGDDVKALSRLFVGLRSSGLWLSMGRFYSISSQSLFTAGVTEFLAQYSIYANGRRLMKAEELTPKIRVTWIQMQRKEKPLSLITLLQGHEDSTTTDIYYDSSGAAMKERRSRLRAELNAVSQLLKTRQFTGLVGKAPSSAELEAGLTIFFFPTHEKGLWGCRDRIAPDWPGFEQRISAGQKCSPSLNCLFCSQCYIFEDSLPYLIDRYAQIEQTLANTSESDFSSSLNAEREVIDWIISTWDDDQAVQNAFAYQQRHAPLFPVDQSVFQVLFDDTAVSVR